MSRAFPHETNFVRAPTAPTTSWHHNYLTPLFDVYAHVVTRDGQKCLNLNLRLNDLLHRHRPSFVQRRSLLLCLNLYQNLYRTHLTQTHHKFMSGWIAKNGRAGFKTTALASQKRIWKVWDRGTTGDAIVSLATHSI